MKGDHIFGYGSLVNGATHDYRALHAAQLSGWRREWRYTSLRDLAYLSAAPDAASSISGVVLDAPPADAKLENREAAYERSEVSMQIDRAIPGIGAINVFSIPTPVHRARGPESALLLSYIDVVVQGYFQLLGEAGVQDFFETTHGWGARIINDRAAPIYPRHQVLDRHETALTDHWLDALAAKVE